jgi:hypothetical protein
MSPIDLFPKTGERRYFRVTRDSDITPLVDDRASAEGLDSGIKAFLEYSKARRI